MIKVSMKKKFGYTVMLISSLISMVADGLFYFIILSIFFISGALIVISDRKNFRGN